MTRIPTIAVLVLVLAATGLGRSAEAACTARDARGTWEVFVIWTDQETAGWTACTLRLNARGGVRNGACEASEGQRSEVGSGRLRVARSCGVTGSIQAGGLRSTIDRAQMTRDKLAIHGVGHDSDGSIWTFSAVKR